ncbi:AP-5 complex subunit mu-1-like isoform X1 [Fundulus heteroclitus]|uniref:AP-5 complex subunit mu-1-like isoform X1 n=1 Tax=Fundulus heteroclitus TaxID=8078 RepID=UPI00165A50D2|nr:AP-5 complex subunit mu-1-like isoform X1 [Fundulus heteroclitus]
MSLRALWIIYNEKGENASIRFSRRFSTVEHRAKSLAGSSYVAVPEDSSFLQLLLTELGLSGSHKSYVAARDDCLYRPRSPAVELRLDGKGTLWPVLALSQAPLILACLPLVDIPSEPRPPLANLLSVSQGLTFLAGLQTFLLGSAGNLDSEGLVSRMATLPSLLLQVCPLGTLLDTPQAVTPTAPTVPTSAGAQKQPAWKTGLHRGRAMVNVAVVETVRSMQYGSPTRQDLWDVYGTVTCKCEVEGVLPNVTVTLSLPHNGSPLQDILVHPCVTSLDSSILTASSVDNADGSAFSGPYKFPFSPPLEPFRLCSYTSQVPVPPILGSYQLKEEENNLRLSVSLKLHESVKNSFEYCAAHLPFFNRNQMGVVDVKVSSGQLDVSKEKNLLVWVLGQKFPKSHEVTMDGKITFSGSSQGPSDPLCTGLTAYIKQLYLKVPDTTLSGCFVDQHSVQVYSSAKPRIITSRELLSKEYYIWNSTGPAPVSSGQMMI